MSNQSNLDSNEEIKLEKMRQFHQWEMQIHQQQHEFEVEKYRIRNEMVIKITDYLVAFSMLGLKAAMIINGGAAIALLAYVGSVKATLELASASGINTEIEALYQFILGVGLTALGVLFAYICQFTYAKVQGTLINEDQKNDRDYYKAVGAARANNQPIPKKPEFKAGLLLKILINTAYFLHFVSFLLVVGATVAFFIGVYTAAEMFQGML